MEGDSSQSQPLADDLERHFPEDTSVRFWYLPALSYAMQRDTAKSRNDYQDFLTLWKDADPEIPILKPAKVEYAKLQ